MGCFNQQKNTRATLLGDLAVNLISVYFMGEGKKIKQLRLVWIIILLIIGTKFKSWNKNIYKSIFKCKEYK